MFRITARAGAALLAASLLLGQQLAANAQSDNFDSYSSPADLAAAGWILSSLNPALVTTTLPAVGAGKGLRIRSNPFPPYPAVGMWYRTNTYTNFYVAVDIASWPGTDKNQAMVMFARMTDASIGDVVTNQNPGTAQGIICNYDAAQHGENPTDRRNGEFQINIVGQGFQTITLAVAEITFVPGRPYRIIFKGTGFHYTAQAYDWNDLTTPLVTIEADDTLQVNTFGASGLLSFSRQGDTGTSDVTYDNYYAGESDPNVATPPALAHPVAGTPAVDTRVPAARWKNFLSPASAISFTANTYSANVINAAATKLRLNGVDVSSSLVLSANGTSITGSLPGSVLDTNKVYNAEIVVTDVAGTKSSTNSFWFDTFSDAFLLSSSAKTIEVEEYNYTNGTYQLDPIPVSGLDTNSAQVNGNGIGYYDLVGTASIDYSNHSATPDGTLSKFRTLDAVRCISGGFLGIEDAAHPTGGDPGPDNVRFQHGISNLSEYVVIYTEVGEWLNYTRSFTPAFYTAYLRYSSYGATSNELHLVTSDPTLPDQTTTRLGTFRIPNNMRQLNYFYAPLVDDAGQPTLLNLVNTNTLRLVIAGTAGQDTRKPMLNYILLAQAPISVFSSATINGAYTQEGGASVNVATRTITIPTSTDARYYRVASTVPVSIKSITVASGTVTLTL